VGDNVTVDVIGCVPVEDVPHSVHALETDDDDNDDDNDEDVVIVADVGVDEGKDMAEKWKNEKEQRETKGSETRIDLKKRGKTRDLLLFINSARNSLIQQKEKKSKTHICVHCSVVQ
jgi:hypothetical protein